MHEDPIPGRENPWQYDRPILLISQPSRIRAKVRRVPRCKERSVAVGSAFEFGDGRRADLLLLCFVVLNLEFRVCSQCDTKTGEALASFAFDRHWLIYGHLVPKAYMTSNTLTPGLLNTFTTV